METKSPKKFKVKKSIFNTDLIPIENKWHNTYVRILVTHNKTIPWFGYWCYSKLDRAIIFTILSAFAKFEKERIATRIREVKQIKKSQGKFTGGKAGFGYEVINGVKVAKKDEQKIISEMRRLKTRGKSYRYTATWLEKNKGVKMTFMGVKQLLIRHTKTS